MRARTWIDSVFTPCSILLAQLQKRATEKRRMFRLIFAFLLVSCATTVALGQTTIQVPGDAASIQAGINAASNGDTVLVAPGTYTENINFNGKGITVTSSGGAAVTIINGNSNGVVVSFTSGEGLGSVINGFTIEGGGPGTNTSAPLTAAGIYITNADPTITNNIITKNQGYGIETAPGSAYISGNTISYTSTEYSPSLDFGCDYDDGVGIFIGGPFTPPPVIDHNTIEYNVGHCLGGGIGLNGAPLTTVITNNIIANNQSLGFGGGVYVINGSVSLIQNLIYDNVSGVAGGGVYMSIPSEVNEPLGPIDVLLTSNTIYGNSIDLNSLIQDAWVDGSQVALGGAASQVGFFNDLIIGNDSYSAIACWPAYQYLSGAPPVVVNSDVLNAGGAAYGGWCTTPADSTGNISADPKFNNPMNGDFHLQTGSPAIDSGFNASPGMLTTDLDSNPRIQNANGASEPIVDMGVYEATGTPESRLTSETTLTLQPGTVYYGQTVNLSTTVTGSSPAAISSGMVNVMDDWSSIQQSALNNTGAAMGSINSLAVGPHWLVASFAGNAAYRPSISPTVEVDVNGFSTSTTISFSANPVLQGTPETLTATVTLSAGSPVGTGTPTGSVEFYGAGGSDAALATVQLNANGTASFTTSSLPAGTVYISAIYQPTAAFLNSGSQLLPLVVTPSPSFAISGTNLSVAPGATTGNASTITVTPSNGFTGSVTMAALLASSPANAVDPPTVSFGSTNPVIIAGSGAGAATLTITTTAPTTSALKRESLPGGWWLPGGETVLACVLLFVFPSRPKHRKTLLGMLALLIAFVGGVSACGGAGNSGGGGGGGGNPGTTAGPYTVTVTATSGTIQQTTVVYLTVN